MSSGPHRDGTSGDGAAVPTGTRVCPSCDTPTPVVALECRECGAALVAGESPGRRWLRWAAIVAVALLGALGTYLAITSLWEPHEEPETDVVWSVPLGAVAERDATTRRHLWVVPADGVVLLSRGEGLRAVDPDTGRVTWRTTLERSGDVWWEGPPVVRDEAVYATAGSRLYALDVATGEELWSISQQLSVLRDVLPTDDALTVNAMPTDHAARGGLFGLDPNTGEERWHAEADDLLRAAEGVRAAPGTAIQHTGGDGQRLYASLTQREVDGDDPDVETVVGFVVARRPADGEHLWHVSVEGAHLTPHVTSDVLVVEERSDAGSGVALAALDPDDGGERWRWRPQTGRSLRTIDIVGDGRVVALESPDADEDSEQLVAIDTAGDEVWRADLPPLGPRGALTASEDVVFVAGTRRDDGVPIWALDAGTGNELWSTHIDAEVEFPERDGVSLSSHARHLYVADDAGVVHALHADDGTTIWRVAPTGDPQAEPPLVVDAVTYVTGADGFLRAIDVVEGEQRWSTRIGTRGFSQPAVGSDGAYAVSGLGSIRALDLATGEERWRTDNRRDELLSATPRPAVLDGTVVAAIGDEVIAADPVGGDERWSASLPAFAIGLTTAGDRIIVADEDGGVRALEPTDGTVAWTAEAGAGALGVFAAGTDHVVVPSADGALHLLRAADGTSAWSATYDDPTAAIPAVGADAIHLVDGTQVRTVDLGTGEERWATDVGEALTGTAALGGDRVYVGTAATGVIVLDTEQGTTIGRLELEHPIDAGPTVVGDRVLVISGGHLVALD